MCGADNVREDADIRVRNSERENVSCMTVSHVELVT